MMQQTLRAAPSVKKRAKSVYSQRNLGTIKDRKREKKQQEKEVDNGEIIMRILRMRCVSRFLAWCTVSSGLFTHGDIGLLQTWSVRLHCSTDSDHVDDAS